MCRCDLRGVSSGDGKQLVAAAKFSSPWRNIELGQLSPRDASAAWHVARCVLKRWLMNHRKFLLGSLLLSAALSLVFTFLLWDRIAVAMAPKECARTAPGVPQ